MSAEEKQSTEPSELAQRVLDSLRQSVHKALDRKRRLGQSAVIWQGGKAVTIGEKSADAGHE